MSGFFPPVELENTLDDAVSKRMRTWLDQCDNGHSSCSHISQALAALPTRLMDLTMLPMHEDMIDRESEWHSMFHSGSSWSVCVARGVWYELKMDATCML